MAERNFYAYQLDFQKLSKVDGENEVYADFWNYNNFKELLDNMLTRHINDIRKIHNGWFMLLDEIKEHTETVKRKGKDVEHKYIVGRFLYAEYGYVGMLRHVDTMEQRENDKLPREGEERYVYFYIRASDGLLLLQGDMKLIRQKVEGYFSEIGREYLQNHEIHDLSVSTLLRGDFLDEVNNLDEVTKIEIELAVAKVTSFENELMRTAQRQAEEFEANYATVVMQSKYRNKGLKGFSGFLEKIKPKGTVQPVNGINNIKVLGKKEGDFKRVYLSKISEKYTVNVIVDDNKNIDANDMYNKVKEIGVKRVQLWRGES
ncbi:hypothetical protein COC65_16770 [Bacillus thuringiensis]|uniref:hypothetical protein n=1 Tax=Bacillus thuringiensis TaxID=1428 RepID=UPI000BFEA19B|nr:hypothetical protein [Bacillus thuringiensis]PGS41321.1 hypothetical protein COC65_16770 [Bacillus thuringiensis]HDR7065671.1 hypothetical protein [Bacillus cereus]